MGCWLGCPMFGRLFCRNGGKYRYDGLTHQFPIGSTLWKFWVAKGSNASSQRDNLNLYACFQIYLIRSRNIQRILLYFGGFKPNMLPVAPQNMYLGGCNQMFMTSRNASSDANILSKKSSELGAHNQNGPSNWIIFLNQGNIMIQICWSHFNRMVWHFYNR